MLNALRAVLVVIALVATGCGSPASTNGPSGPSDQTPTPTDQSAQPTDQPTEQASADVAPTDAPSTAGPPASQGPLPSLDPQAPLEPLPAPELQTADEIVEAMALPDYAPQVVVSMLDQLGIGIYQTDGTTIRAGTEASSGDLYLFEPEVRGLIDMLEGLDSDDGWISFQDFHAALAGLGFQGSAEDLATAYADSYAAQPDEPMSKFVNALTFIDPEVPMPRLVAWLLIVDGFVPPHGTTAALAAGPGFVAASPAPGGGGWGVAQPYVQAIIFTPLSMDPAVIAHLMAVVARTSLTVKSNPASVHEGHGGPGSPAEIKAQLIASAVTYVQPPLFGGGVLFPVNNGSRAGIPVNWQFDSTLNRHGSAPIPPIAARTDVLGQTTITFTPRSEPANGHGHLTQATSVIQATVSGSDLITALYGQPSLGALVPGLVLAIGFLNIEWHDEVMHLELTNPYDVTIETFVGDTSTKGEDTIVGDLTVDENDGVTWRGTLVGNAHGSWNGTAFGESCSASWDATQQINVVGHHDLLTGMIRFFFEPISDPTGSTGAGRCSPTRHKSANGVWFAPFNDLAVTDPGLGLEFIMPPPPGLESDYPVPNPGSGITIRNTKWHVKIELPPPPP